MFRFVLLLLLPGTLLWGACGNRTASDETASGDSAAAQEAPAVAVRDFRLVRLPSGERQVVGTVHNNTSEAIPAAQVQISLFDANNVRTATMSVTVEDIPASGHVSFKKPLTTGETVEGARVQRVLVL